jgi:NADH-quinone oxidoreductase subunit J
VITSLTDAGTATTGEAILFWVLAVVMVLAALGLLFARKAVHAALSLIVVMIGLAFLYVAQDAAFLGVVQVVVYTGAVMMLFLFVLMLVGVDASDSLAESLRGQRVMSVVGGLGLLVVLVGVVGRAHFGPATGLTQANADTNPVALARIVFGDYAFAFEAVGALLITAAVGAIVLTHRRRLTPRVTQSERADARVKAGTAAGKPVPGVYARHNAMDVPALGPDGQPIEASVSRVLRVRGQEADAQEYAARIDRVLSGEWATARATGVEEAASPGTPSIAPGKVATVADAQATAGAKEQV